MRESYLVFDYETRSKADLAKCGGYEYSLDPSTQILCAAWQFGTRETLRHAPVGLWSPAFQARPPKEFLDALRDPQVKLVAHNSFFEQVITKNVLGVKDIPISRWICTRALASVMALPAKMELAAHALHLPVKKDMEGRRLMLKLSKPRKVTKNNPNPWHCKVSDLKRVMEYCASDVKVTTELLLRLPSLIPFERKLWELNQLINHRGFLVDRELVSAALDMIKDELKDANDELHALTKGEASVNKVAAILSYLKKEGLILPNLRAETVRDILSSGIAKGRAKRILEIRQLASKSSTKKYQAFDHRSKSDSRVRDILVYHRASTGRDGGSGVQPLNFPKGTVKDIPGAIEAIKSGNRDWVRALYGNPMDVLSSSLRSVIKASKGNIFFCGDWNAIEARVLFWLAGHLAGIKAFRDDELLYEPMASAIYGLPLERIKNPSPERELGKRAVLGCGFGMGADKFKLTSKMQGGMEISDELAQRAVKAYRTLHRPVTLMWYNIERAAIYAVENPGKRVTINRTTWFVRDGFLFCELPSGRRLAYSDPEVKYEKNRWGNKSAVLYHFGEDPKTKRWVRQGTYGARLTENVVQATARDFMVHSEVLLEKKGYEIRLTVYDEILAEKPKNKGSLEEFKSLMMSKPKWGLGCPMKVSAWIDDRYKK